MKAYIKDAIKVLRDGGIVIFPTDTAFGIGCRIDDEKAIEKLFRIRQRPKDQATPVLVDSLEMAKDYLSPIPKDVIDELIKPYWPGGLTIVLPCRIDKVPKLVRGGGKTIGVRIPDNPVILEIIKRKIGKNKVQITLPMIDKLLKEQGVSLKDLTLIEVNAGSGSFTGIRVGMAIANALSFALKIPVNTIK